jgi:curved DNA-binding protein CbpA
MKFDSPMFDRIRVKPDHDRRLKAENPPCDAAGCGEPGLYRAPKGRHREGQYWTFCLDHVRAYNQSYNYFSGMADDEMAAYQKASVTGHRPTWKMGVGAPNPFREAMRGKGGASDFDPFNLFDAPGSRARADREPPPEQRSVRNAERKALQTLDLDIDADKATIKARFKELVKRHHPDANGGDRSMEDRLREIINAYNYLKSAGFC